MPEMPQRPQRADHRHLLSQNIGIIVDNVEAQMTRFKVIERAGQVVRLTVIRNADGSYRSYQLRAWNGSILTRGDSLLIWFFHGLSDMDDIADDCYEAFCEAEENEERAFANALKQWKSDQQDWEWLKFNQARQHAGMLRWPGESTLKNSQSLIGRMSLPTTSLGDTRTMK
jgi:hypothetical protein